MCILLNYNGNRRVAYPGQYVRMARKACTQAAELESIQNTLKVYVFFNRERVMSEVLVVLNKGMLLSRMECDML